MFCSIAAVASGEHGIDESSLGVGVPTGVPTGVLAGVFVGGTTNFSEAALGL